MKENSEVRNGSERIKLPEMVAYGMGGFGRGIFNTIPMMVLNYFYTNSIGMSAAIVGSIFMFSRVFDGFADILVGYITDRFVSKKHGKARGWMLWTAIPFGLVTFGLFTVPDIPTVGKAIYITIMYNLVVTVFETFFYIPHMTLPALMTKDKLQRSHLTIVNQILAMFPAFVCSLVILPYAIARDNAQSAWITIMVPVVLLGIASMLISFRFTKERVSETEAGTSEPKQSDVAKYGLKAVVKALFANKYWLMALGIFTFDALSNNLFNASQIYYCQYILGDAGFASTITTATTCAIVIALFIAGQLVKRVSKRYIFVAGAIIKTIGCTLLFFLPVEETSFMIARLIAQIGTGFTYATMYAFTADVMEYGEWKTGIRLETVILSCTTVGFKIGLALGPGLSGILMSAAGFDGTLAVQPDSALQVIKLCAIWMPAIFAGFMTFFGCIYDLDDKYDGIVKDLEARKAQARV